MKAVRDHRVGQKWLRSNCSFLHLRHLYGDTNPQMHVKSSTKAIYNSAKVNDLTDIVSFESVFDINSLHRIPGKIGENK